MTGMGSIGDVFGRSLRRNFFVLHAVLFAIALAGVALYVNGQRQDANQTIRATLQQNEDYLLALAVHGNTEGIRQFLEAANDTNPRVKYSWIAGSALGSDFNGVGSVYPIKMGEKAYGAVKADLQWTKILDLGVLVTLLAVSLGLFLFSMQFYRNTQAFIRSQVIEPLEKMSEAIGQAENFEELSILENIQSEVTEIAGVRDAILKTSQTCAATAKEEKNNEVATSLSRVAGQVAHDVRSPLTALEVVSGMLSEVPEDKKQIMRAATQRIRDIANHLVERYRRESPSESKPGDAVFLTPLVERLVSEKRWQFRSDTEKHIEFRFGSSSLETFARVNRVEFQRVISNLMNNAIEALDTRGRVVVSVDALEGKALVQITDNGRGIPPEILSKLGELGLSHGKQTTDAGSGLGVHHAIQCVRNWGGEITFRSPAGQGTTVSVLLPLAPKPRWHLDRIRLQATTPLVLVDDDPGMKAAWKSELERRAPDWAGAFFYFEDAASFEKERARQGGAWNDALFLMDYELRDSPVNGLDLIQRNAIGRQAILATSRFDELEIQERCQSLGVSLLPKGMISLVGFDVKTEFSRPVLRLETRGDSPVL